MTVTLETSLSRVLGPKTATSMAEQLNLHTVRDLLRHYPRRYARRGEQADLAAVACELLDRLLSAGGEMATLLVGADQQLGDTVQRHLSTVHPTIEVSRYGAGPSDIPIQVGVE